MSKSHISVSTVGRQVRVALAERGVSQTQLAAAIGMTADGLSRRITGKVAFRTDEIIGISEHLGVDAGRFFRPIPQPGGGDAEDPRSPGPATVERGAA